MIRSSIHLSSVLLLPRTQQLPRRSTERARGRGPDASGVGTGSRGARAMGSSGPITAALLLVTTEGTRGSAMSSFGISSGARPPGGQTRARECAVCCSGSTTPHPAPTLAT